MLQPHSSASSQLGRTPGDGVAPVYLPHGLEGEIVGFPAHVFFLRWFLRVWCSGKDRESLLMMVYL